MAVFDEAWLAVWWPWLLLWGATAALVVAAAVIAAGRWKGRTVSHHGTPIYLDEGGVMDLYKSRHRPALSRQVEERVSKSGRFGGSAELAPLRAEMERGVTREVFAKYVVTDEAISVISIVVDVLEKADEIVEVDLIAGEVVASDAFDKAFRGRPPAGVRLRQIRKHLLILGEFELVSRTTEKVTYHAPYGDPDHARDARLEIVCTVGGLRPIDSEPQDFGEVRCLGRVQTWNAETRTLKVRPVAIFQ